MSEKKANLETLLQQLHEQLQTADTSDVDEQQLNQLQADIERVLHQDETPSANLRQRLNTAVADFESDHPQLAAAMSQVIGALSNMGI